MPIGRWAALGFAAATLASPGFALETRAPLVPEIVKSGAAVLAAAPSPERVLHLSVSLPLRNEAALDALLADISNPASPNYRHYLSVSEFTDRFGPSAADYKAAVDFFRAQGLAVLNNAANRYLIALDGKVSDVERVFHVKMNLYRHPVENRLFLSPDRAPTLDLSTVVQQVVGLDDYQLPKSRLVHGSQQSGARLGSGPSGQLTGNDIHKAYYPKGALNGNGQSIGLMEFAGLNVSDVQLFFSSGYGPANNVRIVLISTDGSATNCDSACGDDGEQALDVEYAISMAPGLSSVRVYVGNTAESMLNRMASDNISKVLSTSWGWNEAYVTDEKLFKEFAAQGQTNLTASGDYSSLSASGPWPEEDPYIIAVGGTDLFMTGNGYGYYGEQGWSGSAGGPSLDARNLIPSYQAPYVTAANKGSTTVRNVPDIAASANTNMMICANGSCSGGNGGTSFASPIWAGFIALANQYALLHAKPVLGFVNPQLYALGHSSNAASLFHDPVKGWSGKFSSGPSYDLVTGLGSPTGQALIQALSP